MDQVHKQAEFKLDSACNRLPVELLQCRRHVVTWSPNLSFAGWSYYIGHIAALVSDSSLLQDTE